MELSIGRLAKLAGVSIRTVRFYSDIGLVPESGRTDAGYRRYDAASLARLELVITLRELGLDIATARRIAERQLSIEEVAATQADATEAHIRQLKLRLGVLRAIARGISSPEEVRRMTEFARASAEEARRVMDEFLAAVFAGHEDNPFADRMRAGLPTLPDNPSDGQVDAWIELASLVRDPAFRKRVRQMVAEGERQRGSGGVSETDAATQSAGQAVLDMAGSAVATGIDPGSAAAAPIVDALVARFAGAAGRQDDPAYRAELLSQLETFSDARVERYWQLIALLNGWPPQDSMMPAYAWLIAGLRVTGARSPQVSSRG